MINYANLTDKELLGLAIRESHEVVEELFKEFSSLPDLLVEADEMELLKIRGIGRGKAKQIRAIYELSRRLMVKANNNPIIRTPADAAKLMIPEMQFLSVEHFKVLLLNTKNRVIGIETVSIGTLNASLVHPRESFRAAIKKSAASIVAVHNHPSHEPTESKEDVEITKRLRDTGKIIGIELLDHIIIGGQNYVSLKEKGII